MSHRGRVKALLVVVGVTAGAVALAASHAASANVTASCSGLPGARQASAPVDPPGSGSSSTWVEVQASGPAGPPVKAYAHCTTSN